MLTLTRIDIRKAIFQPVNVKHSWVATNDQMTFQGLLESVNRPFLEEEGQLFQMPTTTCMWYERQVKEICPFLGHIELGRR